MKFAQVTGKCAVATDVVNNELTLSNEMESLSVLVDGLEFSDYCTSVSDDYHECILEYGEIEAQNIFQHNIEQECELVDGLYFEAFYTTQCTHQNASVLTYAVFDEPHCIGTPCDGDEGVTLVENQIDESLHSRFEMAGYNCTLSYVRAVRFENVWRRKTDSPASPSILTVAPATAPTLAPVPNDSVPNQPASPNPAPTKAPVNEDAVTSGPADNNNAFNLQNQSPEEEKGEEGGRKIGWTVVIILLIAFLTFGVSYQLWKLLSNKEKTAADEELLSLTV